ncbi:hypothetical protein Ocin01_03303 [Orchesella cincta]|uniref:Uncharacterized protein n=1 Tax=Orchesella cincta TaxID=48709 RepID=A0A1D2NDQ8_ORCCI|nr:hypothetical protein Ocin01_03303 [Orchesella cincta]
MEGAAVQWERERPVTPPPVQVAYPIVETRPDLIVQGLQGRDAVEAAVHVQLEEEQRRGREDHQVLYMGEEASFCAEQLRTVSGFNVTLFGHACCPKLLVDPLHSTRGLSVSSETFLSARSIRYGCFFATSGYSNQQKISFKQGTAELFHLTYKPRIWNAPSITGRFANVLIPERTERIGLINLKQAPSDGAVLIDRVNHLKFTMTRNSIDSLFRIKVLDVDGCIVALANGALDSNPRYSDVCHKHFQISFSDEITAASPLTKTVILSGVIMAAIDWEEKLTRSVLKVTMIFLFIIFLYCFIGFMWFILPRSYAS